ncbi:universal stress protein [Microbacterium sp. A93]|uniref:universal stress protein n=1 Tax=Microbacterium sp. A93 TaxID=3450716 RepID=UPI003F42A598
MSKRIVVGIEQTSAGERALAWAAQRAAERKSALLLVSVVSGALGVVGEGELLAEAERQTQDWLSAESERLRTHGLRVETQVLLGNPVAQLAKASDEEEMLVIGSDYRGPGEGPARGLHGVRIASAASVPVVVIPDMDVTGRTGVVVGVDGSPVSEAAIAFAAAEADRLHEPLIAVAVWTPMTVKPRNAFVYPDDYLENLNLAAEESLALSLAGLRQDYPDLEIQTQVRRGYPSAIISELASDARLAVVGSHGRGAVARFLLGSISHEVLTYLRTPTAVVR